MPWGRNSGNSDENSPPRPSLWLRFQNAVVAPDGPDDGSTSKDPDTRSVDELQAEIKTASDKERAIGLIAAPFAALIAFVIITTLINHDPAALLANGQVNPRHASVSTYHELLLVLLAMSVVMMATALLRKRFFLGLAMALYGLATFNLHYWGFGVPFLLFGAWLLVRTWRLQQSLKLATGDGPASRPQKSRPAPRTSAPRANKRYTPPT
jgi:hypothetical protein